MFLFYREKIEAQLEKEIRLLQLQATNFSTENTAIDLQNRDTEILNIYLVSNLFNFSTKYYLYVSNYKCINL